MDRPLSDVDEKDAEVFLSKVGMEKLQEVSRLRSLEALLGANASWKSLFENEMTLLSVIVEGDMSDWPTQAQSSVCGLTWEPNAIAYKCRTCEVDPTCAICVECFRNGDHTGHDYSIIRTGGGCCDCGDEEAWSKDGFCLRHSVDSDRDVSTLVSQSVQERLTACAIIAIKDLLGVGELARSVRPASHLQNLVNWFLKIVTVLGDGGRYVIGQAMIESIEEGDLALDERDKRFPNVKTWLQALMMLIPYVPDRIGDSLQKLFIGLLGDPTLKLALAGHLIDMYESEWISMGSDSSLLGLSVQLFTVPSVMPLLSERRFVATLIRMLRELLVQHVVHNANMNTSVLMTRNVAFQAQSYFRLVVDLKYLLSTPFLRSHSLWNHTESFYQWVDLLVLCNEMQPCRAQEVESSHEVSFNALYLERHLNAITLRFMDAFVTDSEGNALDYDDDEQRSRALHIFRGTTERCSRALLSRDPCRGDFQASKDELSLFLPMHRMLAQLFDRFMRHWKFSLDDLVECVPSGKQFIRLLIEAPMRALAMAGQVSAKLWESCSMSLLYIADHLRSDHSRRSQIEADVFLVQIGACALGASAVSTILLRRYEVFQSFSFNPEMGSYVKSPTQTTVLIEEALDALVVVGTNRAVCGRDMSDYVALRYLVLHELFMSPLTHSKLDKITPKFLRPLLDDVLGEVAERVKPGSDGAPAMFHVKKELWQEFNPYYIGYTRGMYEKATDRHFLEFNKGKPTIILCPTPAPPLQGMDSLSQIYRCPLVHSRIYWGLLSLTRPQNASVMASSGIVRCCTNLLMLAIRNRTTSALDPTTVTLDTVVAFVRAAAKEEEESVKERLDRVVSIQCKDISSFVSLLWNALDEMAPFTVTLKEQLAPRLLFWLDEAAKDVVGNKEGLRERLVVPLQNANQIVFYGKDIMYNCRQTFTVDLGGNETATHSILSLLSAIRQSDDPRCEFAHSMIDKLLDELSEDSRNKAVINSLDDGKREADKQARLEAAKALRKKRQAEIMAKFQAKQAQFLRESKDAKLNDEEVGGGVNNISDDWKDGDVLEEGDCCALCRETLDYYDISNPFGFASFAQRSNITLKIKERAMREELSTLSGAEESIVERQLERKPITKGKDIAYGKEWFGRQMETYNSGICLGSAESDDESVETEDEKRAKEQLKAEELTLSLLGQPVHDAGHIQSCGHKLHQKCYLDYCESLFALGSDGTFACPLCRSLSNHILPALPPGVLPGRWGLSNSSDTKVELTKGTCLVLREVAVRLAMMFPVVEDCRNLHLVTSLHSFVWYTIEAMEMEVRNFGSDLPDRRLGILRALVAMALELIDYLRQSDEQMERQLRSFCVNEPRCSPASPNGMVGANMFALLTLRLICAPVLFDRRCTEVDFSFIGSSVGQAHLVQIIHSLHAMDQSGATWANSGPAADRRFTSFVEQACSSLQLSVAQSDQHCWMEGLAGEVERRFMPFLRCSAILFGTLFSTAVSINDLSSTELLDALRFDIVAPVPTFLENWSRGEHWRLQETTGGSIPPFKPLRTVCLPTLFQDFVFLPRFSKYLCRRCLKTPSNPAMCLLCGTIVCINSSCCRDIVGECNLHLIEECGTDGIFLVLQSSRVLLLRLGGSGCVQESPYLDEHGEEDPHMSRGKELHFDEMAMEKILLIFLQHRIPHEQHRRDTNVRTAWHSF